MASVNKETPAISQVELEAMYGSVGPNVARAGPKDPEAEAPKPAR